jgi:hypothetical protein
MPEELEVLKPEIKRRVTTLEILQGSTISPLDRVQIMSPSDYEVFILEWLDGYLKSKYDRVRSFAGAGDKGRDLVGYREDGSIDIYQCKHYESKVSRTVMYPELGKICYYTFIGDYAVPAKYFIVAPRGCGPNVLDWIDNPTLINKFLVDNWERYCRHGITKKQDIKLEGDFKAYVEKFDFSIVKDTASHELIEQHKSTEYHTTRFGGGIKKFREVIPKPDVEIHHRELNYTTSLFDVYTQATGSMIKCITDLKDKSATHYDHFKMQRNSFYSAESLEKFSRDNFPDADPLPFDELKDDAFQVLYPTLMLNEHELGFKRVLLASQAINNQTFASNPLSHEIRPLDKDGICNHLVNDNRIKWIN